MVRRPPRSTRTDTLFPYTTLFRSVELGLRTVQPALAEYAAGTDRDHRLRDVITGAERIAIGSGGVFGKGRSEEHTSELQSLMRISYAVFCLKKKKQHLYVN